MRNSMHALKEIAADRRTFPPHIVGPSGDCTTEVLHQIDRYKSADREIRAGGDLFRVGEKGDAIYSLVGGLLFTISWRMAANKFCSSHFPAPCLRSSPSGAP